MSLVRLGAAATHRAMVRTAAPEAETARAMGIGPTATRPETGTVTERAFQQLVEYFPTETVALFMAAVSLRDSLDHMPFFADLSPGWLIAGFTVLTPLMLLTAAYATHREIARSLPTGAAPRFEVPVFDLCASAIAFVPWSLSVPGLFRDGEEAGGGWTAAEAQVLAVFLAFLVAWFLSQLRRIFAATRPRRNGTEA